MPLVCMYSWPHRTAGILLAGQYCDYFWNTVLAADPLLVFLCSPPAFNGPLSTGCSGTETGDVKVGDICRVSLDLEVWQALQEGHGGWDDNMVGVSSAGKSQVYLPAGN